MSQRPSVIERELEKYKFIVDERINSGNYGGVYGLKPAGASQ